METYSITHVMSSRVEKPIFIEQKYNRTCVWYLNKVWSTNFIDDNEILAAKKITNISNNLKMELEIKTSLKTETS